MSIYEERLNRILAAYRGEDVDRIPVVFLGTACLALHEGVTIGDYIADMELNWKVNLKGLQDLGDVDGTHAAIYSSYTLPGSWLSQVVTPGVELGENELWQIHEFENMKQEEYDDVLEMGFGPWYMKFLEERCGNPNAMLAKTGFFDNIPPAYGAFAEAGYPVINIGGCGGPIEMFCGARSLVPFMTEDLIDIPEKVEAAFKLAQEFNVGVLRQQLQMPGAIGIWVGGWRGTPSMLSPEWFDRYAWPYMRELIEVVLESGVIPIMHLDSDWIRGMPYFLRDFPDHSVILHFDGQTDIFKAKEIVGDRQCIMGDVPATMLAFGTPDDVDAYCKRLIAEIGPRSFILCSGCEAPYNSKFENLQTMIESVHKYGV